MSRGLIKFAVLSAVLTCSSLLGAQEEADAEPEKEGDRKADADGEEDYGHGFQFGLRGGLVGGYRMVFGYPKSPVCVVPDPTVSADDQQKFCGHPAPLAIDVGLSFAPLDAIEPFVWGRFGLSGEEQTATEPIVLLGAGLRLYTMSDSRFKIFVEPAVGLEFEGGSDPTRINYDGEIADYGTDLSFRIAAGPQFEITKNVGVFATGGLSVGVLRYLHATLDIQGGVQLRGP